MKNFIKVLFCLLMLYGYIHPGTHAQDKKDISTGYLVPVRDSLVIDKQKIKNFEKQLQQSLPKEMNPKVTFGGDGKDSINDELENGQGEIIDAVTRTINANVDLTEIGINRFIAAQSFPPISGTFPGTNITYTAWITRPYVTLRSNQFRANFTLYVTTSENNNYVIPLNPNLRLDPAFITLSDITAFLDNFPALIESLSIPQMVKDMIIDKYNSLNLRIYPNRLLIAANNLVPPGFNIWITNLGAGYEILDRVLRINMSVTVNAEPPYFNCQWLKREPWKLSLRFYAGVQTTLLSFQVIIGQDHHIYDVNWFINKGEWTGRFDYPEPAYVTTYFIKTRFASPFGEYIRTWSLGFNTATYWTWFQANYRGGIN